MTADNRASEHGLFSDGDEQMRTEYDWDDVMPSTAVVETVSRVSNRDSTETHPIYHAIDPDALDTLCGSTGSGPSAEHVSVEFVFEGYEVRVDSGGTIALKSMDSDS